MNTNSNSLPELREAELASLCTMRIGGVIDCYAAQSTEHLLALRDLEHLRWLGKGANILGNDEIDKFPVAQLGQAYADLIIENDGRVRCGAAVDLAKLIKQCVQAGLAGPEGLAGVPASIGGALYMNAGTASVWILDIVERVLVLKPDSDAPEWVERSAIPAVYRSSGLEKGCIMLGMEMQLPQDDPEKLRARARELKQKKAATQPLTERSAGCIFKNPDPSCPAGKLIDELGLKGTQIGGAKISEQHGNFIVNRGDARSRDVYDLIREIRKRAWQERGIDMQVEVQTWDIPEDVLAPAKDLV